MKIDQIVYVPGKRHIVCVRSFGEHVFKVGDKVTLTSSEEIGLEKNDVRYTDFILYIYTLLFRFGHPHP